MLLRIFTEPQQGASYDDLLAMAKTTEAGGFDAFFRSDHYLAMGDGDGQPGPTDAWVTLAGLARETERIRLGTLVSSATFRLPGPLAVAVAQVDAMSGGRVELGLGTGWYDDEHRAYGIPFPALSERFDRLEEQLAIITGLWSTPEGERFTYEGRHFQVTDSPALPKPQQRPHPPVIVGGGGQRRTPTLAVRFAAEYNAPFMSVEAARAQYGRVRAAAEEAGRDEGPRLSTAVVVCCGADEQELARRAARLGREVDELRANGAAGTPQEVVDTLASYREAGAEVAYLQVLDLADHDHVRLIADQVMPHLVAT